MVAHPRPPLSSSLLLALPLIQREQDVPDDQTSPLDAPHTWSLLRRPVYTRPLWGLALTASSAPCDMWELRTQQDLLDAIERDRYLYISWLLRTIGI